MHRRNKAFGIVFDPSNQPGWQSRMGMPIKHILGKDQIVGTAPKSEPQGFTGNQVLAPQKNLEEFFVTMQVPQLMPSKIRRQKGRG